MANQIHLILGGGFISGHLENKIKSRKEKIIKITREEHDFIKEMWPVQTRDIINELKDFVDGIEDNGTINEIKINIYDLISNLGPQKVQQNLTYLNDEMKIRLNVMDLVRSISNEFGSRSYRNSNPNKKIKLNIIFTSTSEVYWDEYGVEDNDLKIKINTENKRERYKNSKIFGELLYKELLQEFQQKCDFFEDQENQEEYLNYNNNLSMNIKILRLFNIIGENQKDDFFLPKVINFFLNKYFELDDKENPEKLFFNYYYGNIADYSENQYTRVYNSRYYNSVRDLCEFMLELNNHSGYHPEKFNFDVINYGHKNYSLNAVELATLVEEDYFIAQKLKEDVDFETSISNNIHAKEDRNDVHKREFNNTKFLNILKVIQEDKDFNNIHQEVTNAIKTKMIEKASERSV